MAEKQSQQLPVSWQKAQAAAVVLASLAVPVVLAVVANTYATAQKQQEFGVRYVELAVGILRTEPTKETKALREWATSVVDRFAPVPLSSAAKTELEFQQLLVQLSNEMKKQHDEAKAPIRSLR